MLRFPKSYPKPYHATRAGTKSGITRYLENILKADCIVAGVVGVVVVVVVVVDGYCYCCRCCCY